MTEDFRIQRVSKGKTQDRITVPKEWKAEYVEIKPHNLPNVFKERGRYVKK